MKKKNEDEQVVIIINSAITSSICPPKKDLDQTLIAEMMVWKIFHATKDATGKILLSREEIFHGITRGHKSMEISFIKGITKLKDDKKDDIIAKTIIVPKDRYEEVKHE